MIVYVDSSVVLRVVLGQPDRLPEWEQIEVGVTSALTEVECLRTLDRRNARGLLPTDAYLERRAVTLDLLSRLQCVELTRSILARAAAPFPAPLGTLDALHLATALAWRGAQDEDLALSTHDAELAAAARAEGFRVFGVAGAPIVPASDPPRRPRAPAKARE